MAKVGAEKKLKFVEAYLKNGGNGTKAAISAGFSERSASAVSVRLKRDEVFKKAIEKARNRTEKFIDITHEKKIKVLWDIATDNINVNKKAAISAIDVINKMDGSYIVKTDITTNGNSLNAVVILPENNRS